MADNIVEYDNEEFANEDNTPELNIITPKRIYRNVLIISFVFFLTFLSYGGLEVLQSSLFRVDNMGTTTQSVLYTCSAISCLFLPKLAIQKLGHKHCMNLSLIGYITWMAANGYAVWWTMVPASMIIGVSCGTLWAAAGTYITILAEQFANMEGRNVESVLPTFFGIFLMMTYLSGLFANIISSTVLRQSPPDNFTGPSEEDLALCGINDCPGNNVTSNINLQKPAENLVWTLVGIYISIALIGLIVSVCFLDSIPADFLKKRTDNSITDNLKATFRQLIRPKQMLLMPLSIYIGLLVTFKAADWNKSYVTCNLGIWMVGYTSIAFCSAMAAAAFLSGQLVRVTGWLPVFLFAMVIDIGVTLTYIFWTPNPAELVLFFVLPVLSGISCATWRSQSSSFYGLVFSDNNEAAFSAHNLYMSVGQIIGFGYSGHLCTIFKLYILSALLIITVLCYCIVEWQLRVEKSKSNKIQAEIED